MPLFRCVKDTYEPSKARRFKPGMEETFKAGEYVDKKKWRQLKEPETEFVEEPELEETEELEGLAAMTVVDLRKEAAIRGITIPREVTKKAEIIALLEATGGPDSEAA